MTKAGQPAKPLVVWLEEHSMKLRDLAAKNHIRITPRLDPDAECVGCQLLALAGSVDSRVIDMKRSS